MSTLNPKVVTDFDAIRVRRKTCAWLSIFQNSQIRIAIHQQHRIVVVVVVIVGVVICVA